MKPASLLLLALLAVAGCEKASSDVSVLPGWVGATTAKYYVRVRVACDSLPDTLRVAIPK